MQIAPRIICTLQSKQGSRNEILREHSLPRGPSNMGPSERFVMAIAYLFIGDVRGYLPLTEVIKELSGEL